MNKMLPISILENNIRYNDRIDYVEGDDIFQKEEIHLTKIPKGKEEYYINEIIDNYIIENHPNLIKNKTKLNIGSIIDNTSIVETKEIPFSSDLIKDIKYIILYSKSDTMPLKYNGAEDILIIPSRLQNILNSKEEIKTTIQIFNADKSSKNYYFLEDCKIIERTNPILKYIPNELEYNICEKEYGSMINNVYFLFKNMPINLLDNVNTYIYDSMIDVNTSESIFETSNIIKFNVQCYDIAKYGIEYPLPLKLNNDYTLSPINCSLMFIITKLLNIPYIPVCIIKSYHSNLCPGAFNYKKINANVDDIKNFLKPHIILGEK